MCNHVLDEIERTGRAQYSFAHEMDIDIPMNAARDPNNAASEAAHAALARAKRVFSNRNMNSVSETRRHKAATNKRVRNKHPQTQTHVFDGMLVTRTSQLSGTCIEHT